MKTPLWLRLAFLGAGIGLLAWLPFEDTGAGWPLLFAALLTCLAGARLAGRLPPSGRASFWMPPLAGLLGGTLLPLIALLLMAFKSGAHGHPSPDFTPEQVSGLLGSLPLFSLGGLMLGAGAAVWRKTR